MLDILDDDIDDATGEVNTKRKRAAGPDSPPTGDGTTSVMRELECELTDAEVQERGEAMAQDERDIERLKQRRKSLNASIRGKLDHMTELAIAIDTRKEMRDVQCSWVPDYARKVWALKRDDTGKVLSERQMTPIDLQTRLPVGVADDADADADADDAADAAAADAAADADADDADDADPAYLDEPIPGFDAPANDDWLTGDGLNRSQAKLLPAQSARKRATSPARPSAKKAKQAKNKRQSRSN